MPGKLELIVGPSSSGKTSCTGGINRSLRWTTRAKREEEIDSRQYDRTQSTHGFFVTEEEFLDKNAKGELIGVHRYPNQENGNFYGFPITETKEALDAGEKVVEQIVYYPILDEIANFFEDYEVRKILFLSDLGEIRKRMVSGKKKDPLKREEENKKNLLEYLDNIDNFNVIVVNKPANISEPEEIKKYLNDIIISLEKNEMPEVEYDFREGTLGETLKYLMKNEIGLKKAISGLVRIQQQIIPERFALFKTYPLIEGAPNDFLSNMILSSRDYHPADFAAVGPLMLLKLLADLNEPERLQEMAGKIMGGLQRVASNKIGQGGFIETILMQQLYAGLMKKRENLEGLLVSPERHDKLGIEGVSARDFRYQYYCIPGLEELNVLRTLNLALDFGAVISEINETILEDPARVLFYQIGLVKEAHSYASAIGYDSAASALKSYYDYICEETKKSMGANEYSLDLLRGLILNWPTALKEMAEFQSIYLSGFSRIYPVSRTLQAFGALQKINGSAEIVIAQGLEDSYPAQVDKYLAHFSYHFLETVLQVTSNEEAMKDPLNGYPFFKQPNDFVRTYWNGNYAPFSEYAEKFFGGMFKFFKFIAPFYNKRTEGKELVDQNEIRYFISINDKFHAELSRLQENIKKIGKKLGKL